MAIICTNYLTGNDTTGTGSTGAPYKTIMKALEVAVSSDEIRVAGGQWSPITGTMTFTQGSNQVSTTTNLTSQLAAKDILTFDDGEFGFDKFHVRINSITSSTITLTAYWPGPTITTSSVYKLSAYHYDFTTANTGIENFNNAAYLPNGRTGITISGGWDSGYESNANGWTAYRSTNTGALFTGANSPGVGDWRDNLVFDKFLLSSTTVTGLFQSVTGSPGPTGSSFSIGNLALSGVSQILRSGTINPSLGIWNPPGSESNYYCTNTGAPTGLYINSTFYAEIVGSSNTIPTESNYNAWFSISNGTTPNALTFLNSSFPVSTNYTPEGAIFKGKNVHVRTVPLTNVDGYGSVYNGINTQSSYLENLTFYSGTKATVHTIIPPASAVKYGIQIFNPGITGTNASKSGIVYGNSAGQTLIELSGKTIESTRPCFGANNGATAGTIEPNTSLTRIAQSYLSPIQVKDSEGLKTMDVLNNVYYKDPINNWLRISGTKISASAGQTGGFKGWSLVAVLEKPQTAFTVSVTMKVEGGTWDQIGVQYGPQTSQVVTQSITPTSSFATYTLTVDPSSYSDWNSFIFPLYIGIRFTMPNIYYEEEDIKCYIQSLTIV